MQYTEPTLECKNCLTTGSGNYCPTCGEAYHSHRITIGHMIHEVVHLLTHFDKSFTYTLKKLITQPGFMQLDYIAGHRKRHQKPFSMFFLCSTISALGMYWINKLMGQNYGAHNTAEVHFFQHYFVILQMCLVPIYALINYIAYWNSKYNYAEFLVILLYNTSLIFLFLVLCNAIKLFVGELETGYIEMTFVLMYNFFTYLNFFNQSAKWVVVLKVIITSALCFAVSRGAMALFIKLFLH
jgi:hypothetical protein